MNYRNRADMCIAHGSLTNSKRPECFVNGCYPTHMKSGKGAQSISSSDIPYIDFVCSLGANLLGHGNEKIAKDIYDQYLKGSIYSIGSTLEVEAAEAVKALFPFIHKLRFLKTGTEACMAAVRIARSYHEINKTGKNIVLSSGYHGWHDAFIGLTPPALGVIKSEEIRKFVTIEDIDDNTACVIVEPIVTDISTERIHFLNALRDRCTKTGATLIFDEIITCFRFPKYSVSSYYGIDPDLICLGKAMAGGLPLSVVGGHRDIMDCGEYFVSSTFAGDTLALRAFMSQFEMFQNGKFDMMYLWNKGSEFIRRFNAIWPEKIRIDGYPTRGVFEGDCMVKRLLWQEAALSQILLGSSFFFNFSHIEHIDVVISLLKDILIRIKNGQVKEKGDGPVSPFAQEIRNG